MSGIPSAPRPIAGPPQVTAVPDKDGGIGGKYTPTLGQGIRFQHVVGAGNGTPGSYQGGSYSSSLPASGAGSLSQAFAGVTVGTTLRRRTPSAAALLDKVAATKRTGQRHENDIAEVVLVCEPDLPKMMGSLHPAGSLYERPINMDESKKQHETFRKLLKSHGIHVLTVREILVYGTETNVKARIELEDLAAQRLIYELDPACDERLLSKEDRFYIGDIYKRSVIEVLSADQLVEICLTCPTVRVQPSYRDTGFTASYSFQPLSNLIFTRDQQITTARGVVMGRLRSEQRKLESSLMRFCLEKIGITIVGEIESPGYLEGGDFFAAGNDLCLIGIGLRSNYDAVHQCMQKDYFGTRRVAVVKDDLDHSQDRMHLDCCFSILSESCCLMLETMMGEDSPKRRMVDEWVRGEDGVYTLNRENIEFAKYMGDNEYNIIPISAEDQLAYGCNILNLGGSNIISVHKPSARLIARSPHFHGNVDFVEYRAITSAYGAVHCSSQVLSRKPYFPQH